MKLGRLPNEPSALVDFYREALENLGAVCERTWYDRLELVAEGRAARLWNDDGDLFQTELYFPPSDDTSPRNAATEVFPGCPLTFRLAEALQPTPLAIDRLVLAAGSSHSPAHEVVEKLWHAQFPHAHKWRITRPFTASHEFSLLALLRCEIQAIDQHWSLHRVAIGLADESLDDALATNFGLVEIDRAPEDPVAWPKVESDTLHRLLHLAVHGEVAAEIAEIRARQERYLRRELERIDAYFLSYEADLASRRSRASEPGSTKSADRLAATKAEHARRRADQVKRHEIRIIPHCDALLLVAERACETDITFHRDNAMQTVRAMFNPRRRRWII